eukprot:scaffold1741_cov262-Pinguiococcus_pyrenoidosus.AAC.23
MDSNDQERERGITILSKNAAVNYKGTKINIVDTPGHADFGGEVERIMNMVDGVLLIVDSVEGPKPQTRFVLKKALEMNIQAIVVINKIDRPSARPDYVLDTTFDLFVELGASDEQTDFKVVYASGLNGIAGLEPDALADDLTPLFDTILELPGPKIDVESPLQLLVANIDFDDFKGKLGIGRIRSGTLKKGASIGVTKPEEPVRSAKIGELFVFDNLGRTPVDTAKAGDIVMFSGVGDVGIGDTLVDKDNPMPLPPIAIEEPTVRMTFSVNKSPLAGQDPDSKFLTSRMIRDRLEKELDRNVALKIDFESGSADSFEVSGRGQLHLTVLIETMRREGFEMTIGPPRVILKTIDGKKHEPFETIDVAVPDEYVGSVVDLMARRRGEMQNMMAGGDSGEGFTQLNFVMPTRGMIGLRSGLLTATRGTAVIDSTFEGYRPWAGDIETREKGSLLAYETGTATTFGIIGAQDRGQMFIDPKTAVYKDMIVGIHQRPGDLKVNVCKTKALNNIRSATKEVSDGVIPPVDLTLDSAVEYIQDDEEVEVTPNSLRMAKQAGWDKKKSAGGGKGGK